MTTSLKGHLLIAGPKLRDRNFFKTVLLVLEHTPEGAMGLVVNRPSSLSISNALAGHLEIPDDGDPVFAGGPVEPADLFLLHDDARLDGLSVPVVDGMFVTTSEDAFEALLTDTDPPRAVRVLSGYAGWAAEQLDCEVAGGDWLSMPATAETVFDMDPYEMWDELKDAVTRSHRILAQPSGNPEWN